jgi:hypothetical protein
MFLFHCCLLNDATKLHRCKQVNIDVHQKTYSIICQTSYVYQHVVFCAVRHYRFVALVGVQASAPLGAAPGVAPLAQSPFVELIVTKR